ncbi:MAG TPA: NAD(P)-dependent oxidoreductase [Ktedonobacteraceae bacterium]|nr:NAD(P)-dependent oxidoreductase [Ktedonobacteraceae bacterium]
MPTREGNTKPHVGFIGLGHMGSHMATRLLDAGYALTVYDRTRERTQPFRERGATVAQTPRDVAAGSEFTLSCVTNDAALDEIMFGREGALSVARPGATYIDLSTVSPVESRKIYGAAREKRAEMLDAAVSGSVPQVESGDLVIFVGGEQQVYEKCQPILQVLGHKIFHMGGNGMGTTMKLVVNTLLGLSIQALAEAFSLGEKAGLDKKQLIEVLDQTAVLSPSIRSKLENVQNEVYPVNFALSLMYKDFSLILQEAHEREVPMPATAAAHQMFAAASAEGVAGDFSAIVHFMETLSGIAARAVQEE